MHFRVKGARALALACLVFAISVPLSSQTTTGRIIGNVHDQTGAAVAGANLTITDIQRGTVRNATTDDSGGYVVSNLTPGVYTLHVEAKGFKTVERRNIQVEVATDLTVEDRAFTRRCQRDRGGDERGPAGEYDLVGAGRNAQQ